MARVHGRAPTDPALSDRLLGLLLVLVAGLLLWWWASSLGLEQLVQDKVAELTGVRSEPSVPAVQTAEAAPAESNGPFCAVGQQPRFVLGFADLRRQVGAAMGEPVECEHANPGNGDALQQTTTGLAYYRKATNMATFTDGWRHWALTANGLVSWEGDSPDPPNQEDAKPVSLR